MQSQVSTDPERAGADRLHVRCRHWTALTAVAKAGGGTVVLQTLTFTWGCAGAIVCVEGPSATLGAAGNQKWKYVGDLTGGTSGKLVTVHDGVRDVVQIGYDASSRPLRVKNANELNAAAASAVVGRAIGSRSRTDEDRPKNKVTSVIERQVADRKVTPMWRDLTWVFAYSAAACRPVLRRGGRRMRPIAPGVIRPRPGCSGAVRM